MNGVRIYQAPVAVCPGCGAHQPYVAEEDPGNDRQCQATWHERGRVVRVTKRLAWWFEDSPGGYVGTHPLTFGQAFERLAWALTEAGRS